MRLTMQTKSAKRETKRQVVFNTADGQTARVSWNNEGFPFAALTIVMDGNDERKNFILQFKEHEIEILKRAIAGYENKETPERLKIGG